MLFFPAKRIFLSILIFYGFCIAFDFTGALPPRRSLDYSKAFCPLLLVEMLPSYRGENRGSGVIVAGKHMKTLYLGPQQRPRYQVSVADGIFVDSSLHPLNAEDSLFALSPDAQFYLLPDQRSFQHSTALAGGPVAAVGSTQMVDGLPKDLRDDSGHYSPRPYFLYQFLQWSNFQGVQLPLQISFYSRVPKSSMSPQAIIEQMDILYAADTRISALELAFASALRNKDPFLSYHLQRLVTSPDSFYRERGFWLLSRYLDNRRSPRAQDMGFSGDIPDFFKNLASISLDSQSRQSVYEIFLWKIYFEVRRGNTNSISTIYRSRNRPFMRGFLSYLTSRPVRSSRDFRIRQMLFSLLTQSPYIKSGEFTYVLQQRSSPWSQFMNLMGGVELLPWGDLPER